MLQQTQTRHPMQAATAAALSWSIYREALMNGLENGTVWTNMQHACTQPSTSTQTRRRKSMWGKESQFSSTPVERIVVRMCPHLTCVSHFEWIALVCFAHITVSDRDCVMRFRRNVAPNNHGRSSHIPQQRQPPRDAHAVSVLCVRHQEINHFTSFTNCCYVCTGERCNTRTNAVDETNEQREIKWTKRNCLFGKEISW